MALEPGDTLLNDRYCILRLLERGDFGFVYQAQDTLLGERIAIKELNPGLVGDEVTLERLLAEARATMRLADDHIEDTHNVFQEGDNYYIVMAYMDEGSLEEQLQEHGAEASLRQQTSAAVLPLPQLAPEPRRPVSTPAPAEPGVRAVLSARRRIPLPAWFWPAVGIAAVLLIVLVVAFSATLGGKDDTETASSQPTQPAVAVATAAPALTPTQAPPQAGATQTRSQDGMVMVYVPAGDFLMGSTMADDDVTSNEVPQHTVYLDAFWIDKTEVSNAQYTRFLNALRGHQGKCQGQWCIKTYSEDTDSHIVQQGGQYVVEGGYEDHPIIEVTWYGAQAYCEWAGARLPTEAEWEKAARGTDKRTFPWGEGIDCSRANYGHCVSATEKVGSYPTGASPYGALDMGGNVWEWVADWYASDYYARSPKRNPQGPESGSLGSLGSLRVRRGGAWHNRQKCVRTVERYWRDPSLTGDYLGFRCVRPDSGL